MNRSTNNTALALETAEVPERSKARRNGTNRRACWLLAAILVAVAGGGAGLWAFVQQSGPVFYDYEIVNVFPHDPGAFTQGLEYVDGSLYEGTGQHGLSELRRVDLETGQVLQRRPLNASYFGEGITILGNRVYQLTWQSRVGFIYDRKTFRPVGRFRYSGEGWGMTQDGRNLILSDGSSTLRFLNPRTFQVTRRLRVSDRGQAIDQLNELEYINGEIYANIWNSDWVARISPQTGAVTGWIDMRGLIRPGEAIGSNAVLNGIAHDAEQDRLFVTGKNWPKLFEIKLVPKP
ncbi:glutaminyl-peptide cyclotransferase [soil metagenome]